MLRVPPSLPPCGGLGGLELQLRGGGGGVRVRCVTDTRRSWPVLGIRISSVAVRRKVEEEGGGGGGGVRVRCVTDTRRSWPVLGIRMPSVG